MRILRINPLISKGSLSLRVLCILGQKIPEQSLILISIGQVITVALNGMIRQGCTLKEILSLVVPMRRPPRNSSGGLVSRLLLTVLL
jgi:hypothetical protein